MQRLLFRKLNQCQKKINLNLFEDFFESLPADYAEMLINTENSEKNKEFVAEIKSRISDLKGRIKKISKTEKKLKCWWDIRDY